MATTPQPDRAGDILETRGATFRNPLPLLLHHDSKLPIGIVTLHPATDAGIAFDAVIPTIDEPGALRDRVNEAWQSIKAGLITGVSVGFRILDGGVERLKTGAARITRAEICELSLVTVPANMQATIHTIKSLDSAYLAAIGPNPSGAPDFARKGLPMTAQEQVQQFENSRAAKVARMAAIMETATDTTLPEHMREEYDGLSVEVKGLDDHLTRARELERLQAATATRVPNGNGNGTTIARVPVVNVKSNVAPGTAFARYVMAILATKGSKYEAIEYAKRWDRETPEVGLCLKAAVAAGNTTDPAWAGVLTEVRNMTGQFIELLRPATILGRIPGLRKSPFNVSVPIQTAGGSYNWVGQGLAKPVTKLGFGTARLEMSKAAGIIVLTEELARTSDPSAEEWVRRDMIRGISAFLDQQFIDPAVAYVANVHPASITNGIVGTPSTGDPYEDMVTLFQKFTAAGIPLAGSALIMSETNALHMAFARDPLGNRMFPSAGVSGGSVEGVTLVTSNHAGTNVVLVQPEYILYADDGGVTVDVSREASVQMDDAPAPADATTVLVSLWQNNLIGLRAERFINWKRGLDAAVALVTAANYAVPPVGLLSTPQRAERKN